MKRQSREPHYNFWPCVSDLMLATFMLMMLLWLIGQVHTQKLTAANEPPRATSNADAPSPPPPSVDPEDYARAMKKVELLMKENALLRRQPPNVNIAEAKGFAFNVGTVVLSDGASENFENVVVGPLIKLNEDYEGFIDTIEVIGYTDEKANPSKPSDLDAHLTAAIEGRVRLDKLSFGSNADLGLLRAVAIMQRLKKVQREGRLPNFPIHAYSAAQINPPESLPATGDTDKALRRMEIRLTRRNALQETPKSDS